MLKITPKSDAAPVLSFDKPHPIPTVDRVFPTRVSNLMPAYDQIPEEFKNQGNIWSNWQSDWFFKGLKQRPTPKPGINLDAAMSHLSTIQGSWEPKHQHKAAGVAYLASLWFENP